TTTTTVAEKVVVTVIRKSATGEVIETKDDTITNTPTTHEAQEKEEETEEDADPKRDVVLVSEDSSIFLGLKVYTHRYEESVSISGQLRHEMEVLELTSNAIVPNRTYI
ncbi:hypothetical protein MPER_00420, partial [Moniliophthora perniciosa FA553]